MVWGAQHYVTALKQEDAVGEVKRVFYNGFLDGNPKEITSCFEKLETMPRRPTTENMNVIRELIAQDATWDKAEKLHALLWGFPRHNTKKTVELDLGEFDAKFFMSEPYLGNDEREWTNFGRLPYTRAESPADILKASLRRNYGSIVTARIYNPAASSPAIGEKSSHLFLAQKLHLRGYGEVDCLEENSSRYWGGDAHRHFLEIVEATAEKALQDTKRKLEE